MTKMFFYDRNQKFKLSVLTNKLFLAVLFAKLIAGFLFASEYLTTLFYPFIDYFVNNSATLAYDSFYFSGKGNSFPYPVLMLYITGFFKLFFSNNNILSFIDLGLIRAPILLADITILIVLCRWLKQHQKQVILFYWLNPILFYINYLHGQLDIIPTAFLIISLYFIFKRNWALNALFTAFAILCKTNFILIIPFLILYMYKSDYFRIKEIIGTLLVSCMVFFIVQIPFINNPQYLNIVYNNDTQVKFLNLFISFQTSNQTLFYVAPASIILLLFYGLMFKNFNRNLFILFLGFCFAIITLLAPPSQGWYCWFLPLMIYFLIKNPNEYSKLFYWIFTFAYFIYFLIIPKSDFLNLYLYSESPPLIYYLPISGELKDLVVNFSFTFLQLTLLMNCILMLVNGIESYKKNKLLYKPLLIGVGGDSGSGKTTFSNILQKLYGESKTIIIKGDDMHKWERGDDKWKDKTHLNPSSNYIHKEIEFIKFLKKGISIKRRTYDHNSGKFTIPSKIKSKRVVIYEGLHPFYLSDMKNSFDITFFIQPDEELRKKWKINRDTKKRGYSKEKIIEQLKQREKDSLKYIQSQADSVDVLVSFKKSKHAEENLQLSLTIDSNIDLEMLLLELNKLNEFNYEYHIDQIHQHLVFHKGLSSKKTEEIAYNINSEIDEYLSYKPKWDNEFNGILQLVQIVCVQNKLAHD